MLSVSEWAAQPWAQVQLGDQRLTRRAVILAAVHPAGAWSGVAGVFSRTWLRVHAFLSVRATPDSEMTAKISALAPSGTSSNCSAPKASASSRTRRLVIMMPALPLETATSPAPQELLLLYGMLACAAMVRIQLSCWEYTFPFQIAPISMQSTSRPPPHAPRLRAGFAPPPTRPASRTT